MKHAKVDDNQAEIVAVLRSLGVSVQSLASVGKGTPDLLCGHSGVNWLFEVKDGNKAPSARKLTTDQVEWHGAWRGSVHVIKNATEAMRLLELIK